MTHTQFRRLTLSAASLAIAALVAGCQTAAVQPQAAAGGSALLAPAVAPVLRQDAFNGIYEVAAARDGSSVFVATIADFDSKSDSAIHRLDARTLQTQQTVHVPRRSFALGLNNQTGTLFAGNTMEGSISVVDASSGIVTAQIQLAKPETDAKGEVSYAHTRKVIVDEAHNRIFVTSPGEQGLVWIVDTATNTLTHTIQSEGLWTAGAAYDEAANILYVGQGGKDEVLAIDPDAGKVLRRFSTGDSAANTSEASKHFFVNLALDAQGQRLFAADSNTNQVYVLDLRTGAFVKTVAVPGEGLLDVVYSPARNQVLVTSRGASHASPNGTGFVALINGQTYAIEKQLDLPVHPNSLALSPNGQTLYVTVKAPHGDKHSAWRKGMADSVVRIDLEALK